MDKISAKDLPPDLQDKFAAIGKSEKLQRQLEGLSMWLKGIDEEFSHAQTRQEAIESVLKYIPDYVTKVQIGEVAVQRPTDPHKPIKNPESWTREDLTTYQKGLLSQLRFFEEKTGTHEADHIQETFSIPR